MKRFFSMNILSSQTTSSCVVNIKLPNTCSSWKIDHQFYNKHHNIQLLHARNDAICLKFYMPYFPQPTRPAIATHVFKGSWDVTHTNTYSFVHIPHGLQKYFLKNWISNFPKVL